MRSARAWRPGSGGSERARPRPPPGSAESTHAPRTPRRPPDVPPRGSARGRDAGRRGAGELHTAAPSPSPASPSTTTPAAATPSAATPSATTAAPAPTGTAPAAMYAVGRRELRFDRGADRPLPVTVWYPARGARDTTPRPGLPIADGRFPVVLLGQACPPEPAVAPRWWPRGPRPASWSPRRPTRTPLVARPLDVFDVINQPPDASYVLTEVLALETTRRRSARTGGSTRPGWPRRATRLGGSPRSGSSPPDATTAHRRDRARRQRVSGWARRTRPPRPTLFVHGDK